MTVLLLTIGSAGDVHPFIGIGQALRRRGHRVRVIVNPYFADVVGNAGLEHIPLGKQEDFEAVRDNPDLWHRTRGFATIVNTISAGLRTVFDTLMENYVPGETVIGASSLALGARVAQDKFDLPMASIHLSPALFRSVHQTPKLPGLFMPGWMPRSMKRAIFSLGDWAVIDRLAGPPINQLRREVGLAPVRGILAKWWHSPRRVIAMFPEWFAPLQPDWPEQTRLTGFPLYDEGEVSQAPVELGEFLAAGSPPIAFAPGSAMFHASDFFRQSALACQRLGQRGILLTRNARDIPAGLPATIRHFPYVPFSALLPHLAAFVHHGGIGTSAQAMAAGVKQIIWPLSHDQLDNADRMRRLGVARVIEPKRYKAPLLASVLGEVLGDQTAAAACGEIARKFEGISPLEQTCELIEGLRS